MKSELPLLHFLLCVATAALPAPLERYLLTTCHLDAEADGSSTVVIPSLAAGNDSLLGSLISHGPYVSCDATEGARILSNATTIPGPNLLESNHTLLALRDHYCYDNNINSSIGGLTIALWMTPDETTYFYYSGVRAILTLGDDATPLQQQQPPCDTTLMECPGYNVRLAQLGDQLVVSFTDIDGACRMLRVKPFVLMAASLTHVVVTFGKNNNNNNATMAVYVNGEPVIVDAPATIDVRQWIRANTSSLQLFSNYQNDGLFRGSLLQVDLYDQALGSADVAAVFQQGVVYATPTNDVVLFGPTLDPCNICNSSANNSDVVTTAPPGIIAQGVTDPIAMELHGYNVTTAAYKLAVQVKSLPLHGTLYTTTGSMIEVDSIVPFFGSATGITVLYKLGSTDYFNVPETNAYQMNLHLPPESFLFGIVVINGRSEVIQASNNVVVQVNVVHVNHPLTLTTVPAEATFDTFNHSKAYVTGIEVADPLDFNLERVRVDLWSHGGTLTLDLSHRARADFESCRYRTLSAWQCVGDGIDDRQMTFVAIPDDLSLLLHNLSYVSFVPGAPGEIGLRIYDGAGGLCLDEQEHVAYSLALGNNFTTEHHNECYQVEATIQVPQYDVKQNPTVGGTRRIGLGLKKFALDVTALTLVVMCTCGCCSMLPRCLARGESIPSYSSESSTTPDAVETKV